MSQVLPTRWEQFARTQSKSCGWTRAELLDAFAELSNQHTLKKRFCFFIDGLDEYDGDHSEIVDLVQGFVRSKDIKVCLSSRPWNVFTRAFGWGSYPKFHLEDLTQLDIKLYVQDTLGDNQLFRQLAAGKDSARCRELEDVIIRRAQGVFLWVFLVVRSLIQGLTNADRITDLERRLQSLPTDLEAYFRHMLEDIDGVYVQKTVQTFQIALHATEPLSLMTYEMMDELEENPRYAMELPVQQMKATDVKSRCQNMKLRINARCKDLLQVTRKGARKVHTDSDTFPPFEEQFHTTDRSNSQDTKSDGTSNCKPSPHPFFEYEVDFLHRTVKDFFQVNDVQRFIAGRIPETFNPSALLCHAFLAQIKVAPIEVHHFDHPGELPAIIDDLAHYAHQLETQKACPVAELFDQISAVIHIHRDSLRQRRFDDSMNKPYLAGRSITRLCQSFLSLSVQNDLLPYVTHKLDERLRQGSATPEFDELVLDALHPSVTSNYGVPSTNRTLLRSLVDVGVNSWRLWNSIIGQIRSQWARSTNDTRVHHLEIVTALLEVGTDPNWSKWEDHLLWVEFILIPSANWRTRSVRLEAALTRTIVAFCERGIDPYWNFMGFTLWGHFIRSIYDEGRIYAPFSLETKGFVLVVIKKFISLGARLDDMVYHNIAKYEHDYFTGVEDLSANDVLTRILTKKEMEELAFQGMPEHEGSKAKATEAQRRKNKKKRRKRRKVSGH